MMWVLIVSWAVAAGTSGPTTSQYVSRSHAITMQEFVTAEACLQAAFEAQKIAPGIRVVCVSKGKL